MWCRGSLCSATQHGSGARRLAPTCYQGARTLTAFALLRLPRLETPCFFLVRHRVLRYYPHDAAHALVARALIPSVRGVITVRSPRVSLPTIDDRSKHFFSHVHKAMGTAFYDFLKALPSAVQCTHLMASNQAEPASWESFAHWWAQRQPNCSIVSLEEPKLGSMLRSLTTRGAFFAGGGVKLLTLYRDPVARCRSHWTYDQKLCHSSFGQDAIRASFCTDFLKMYGAVNNTAAHDAFAKVKCDNVLASEFQQNGWPTDFDQLSETIQLSFVGIAEEYEASLCLYLFQAGRFPHEGCTCDAARTLKPYLEKQGYDLGPRHAYALAHLQHIEVPPLRFSRAELERRSPMDMAFYQAARRQFEQRVRRVEEMTGTRFMTGCEHRTKLWSPSTLLERHMAQR